MVELPEQRNYMDKIYIFETRQLAYLDSYVEKAKSLNFQPIILSGVSLMKNDKFDAFKSVYQHLSVNSYEFEVNCFARYFALASVVSGDDSFILSDSDIYITSKLVDLKNDVSIKNVFVGSEGFCSSGSELQISPHFSIWNRVLLNNFVDFIIKVYTRNLQDQYLVKHFESQKSRLGRTSISDMTLLYMWVHENDIPYINSNSNNNTWGIDHNISALLGQNEIYQSFFGRKKINRSHITDLNFVLCSGQKLDLSVIHFQGGYKQILNDFYLGNYTKFIFFSMYIKLGRDVKAMLSGLKNLMKPGR